MKSDHKVTNNSLSLQHEMLKLKQENILKYLIWSRETRSHKNAGQVGLLLQLQSHPLIMTVWNETGDPVIFNHFHLDMEIINSVNDFTGFQKNSRVLHSFKQRKTIGVDFYAR